MIVKKIDNNPFPIYTSGNDENLYYNIYNFLNSGIKNGKRLWPDYIEKIKDKQIKSNKKLAFYRKIGFFKKSKQISDANIVPDKTENNKKFNDEKIEEISNEKNDKYVLEKGRLMIIKYESINSYKKNKVLKKYIIPFIREIPIILKNNHDKMDHPGRDSTLFNVKRDNYYWINIKKDIENYIKNCLICCKYKNNQKKGENQKHHNFIKRSKRSLCC